DGTPRRAPRRRRRGRRTRPRSLTAMPGSSALLTDLYQLTMLSAYVRGGKEATAVFDLTVRRLPPRRNFLIAAGLEQALDFLAELRFTAAEIDWLVRGGHVSADAVGRLASLRFTGDVDALP